ncbi:hypothetical protein PJM27_22390 [Mycobacterium kansasii]
MRPLVKRTPEGRRYAVPSAPRYPTQEPAPQSPSHRREPRAKLSDDDVRDIRADYAAGRWSQKDLAYIYGVSQPTISGVVNGDTWIHVADEPKRTET